MIKRLFSGQINNITIAAMLVAFSSTISRLLGLFRDRILASEFGAGDFLDVYLAAFRIPDLIFNLLVLGALSAGFIPILTSVIKDQKCNHKNKDCNKEAWYLVNNILNILGFTLIILSLLGIFFAPILMKVIVPGYIGEKRALTIALTRIMFLSPMFLGISGVFGGILQSFKRFFVYSLAPILYNVGIIIGAVYFVPIWGIYGLAYGVVLGAFLHMFVQIPTVFFLGYRYKLFFNTRDKNIRKIGRMMIPRTLSLAISQVNLLVITTIASTLASGALVVFNFANNLQSFPIGIFGISFAIAAFPTLSKVAKDNERLVENFSAVFRRILFFIVPSTVLLLTLRIQMTRVIYGAGEFDWEATKATAGTLGYFSLSLFAQASIPLLVRVFYARHDSKTPFVVGFFSAVLNVVLSFYFSHKFGVAGLALAFSLASIFNFSFLWILLRVKIGDLDETHILFSAIKFAAAALACGFVAQSTKIILGKFVDMERFWGVFTQGFVAGVLGLVTYFIFCSLFRSEEFFSFWSSFRRKLPWKKAEIGDQGEARGM